MTVDQQNVARPHLLDKGDVEAAVRALGLTPGSPFARKGARVHLVGVGGTGMSNMAAYLNAIGCKVTGSDMGLSETVQKVRELGVDVAIGHAWANLPARTDVVVATAAVPAGNPEIRAARKAGVPVLKYAQMLGVIMRGRRGVAVAGTHGKTTTTSMIATVLARAGLEPSFMIGGVVPCLTRDRGPAGCVGQGDILVAEACEYDRSFLNLRPWLGVITNIEPDHLDYFRDEADLIDAFRAFAERTSADGLLLVNADDARVTRAVRQLKRRRVTFGQSPGADWQASPPDEWRRRDGFTHFNVTRHGQALGEFRLRPPGPHNVMNALGALAACHELGVQPDAMRAALETFTGAARRFEYQGAAFGVDVIDDYAHHPTEIAATLQALQADYAGAESWVVFQPHQHSRTRLLMDEFARCFDRAHHVIVPDIYRVRDSVEEVAAVSSAQLVQRLCANGVDAEYMPTLDETVDWLAANVNVGDVVLTMGAGPVNRVGHTLLRRLGEDEQRVRTIEQVA